ncbi:MAG: 3-deoxy-manno-octulosonate cytidylyltransferase [Deltaproteobacteria bacterium]|nr:MAG: 3-deoxy-manno-octulosonate cytidylyltransferase [Deltaproteobacteria bacterium]
MKHLPTCYGIIPARYGSTRFPGKPLAEILGKPMFWHVFEQARQCPELKQVVLATDDNRIFSAAKEMDVPVLMTRTDHPSGTDRVLEAAQILEIPKDSVVVNIQGDEPALEPMMLSELLEPFTSPETQVATLVRKVEIAKAENSDVVTVVFSKNGRALYFSRSVIPHPREGQNQFIYEHIGLYAFRMQTLKKFVALGPSRLEKIEKLEQLRLLENEIPIHIVVTRHRSFDVDRPDDIQRVSQILAEKPEK